MGGDRAATTLRIDEEKQLETLNNELSLKNLAALSLFAMLSRVLLLLAGASSAAAWLVAPAPQLRTLQRSRASLRMADDDEEGFTFGDVSDEAVAVVEEVELTERQKEIARLKAAEKFMKKDTGDAQCTVCEFTYKMETGTRLIPRNTPFELLPDSFACPTCNSPKAFFNPVQIEIAGFADNQQYGIGTNTWTEEQKSIAIFGGLGFFVLLFLGGYALN